jgi:predicted HAD superfamily Cof-like phosphohydrolase
MEEEWFAGGTDPLPHPMMDLHRKMLGPSPMLRDWFADVLEFHRKFGCVIGSRPAPPDAGTADLRYVLMEEELDEFDTAASAHPPDLAKVADGLADLIYVAIGTAISYGIDLRPVWEAIHAANCTKVGGTRADGKVMKGSSWVHPDIGAILARQGPLLPAPEPPP